MYPAHPTTERGSAQPVARRGKVLEVRRTIGTAFRQVNLFPHLKAAEAWRRVGLLEGC